MKDIIKLLKKEATKRECSILEVLEDLEEEVQLEAEKNEKEQFSKEFAKGKLEEHKSYPLCFIEKDTVENIWFADSWGEYEKDKEGYVSLKPLMHYEYLDVEKKQLIRITKDEANKLIKLLTWLDGGEFEMNEKYQKYVEKILNLDVKKELG